MIRILSVLILAILSIPAFSQETTIGDAKSTASAGSNDIVIIPFGPNLYISDIDFQIEQSQGLTNSEIKAKFRAGLDQSVYLALKPKLNPFSYYTIDENESRTELSKIYNSIGYNYELIPQENKEEEKKFINKFKKDETKREYTKASISNGEVVSEVDNREKYMKTVLSDKSLIDELNTTRKAKYYLFINQLDIRRGTENQYAASHQKTERKISVHYTIFDNQQKEISSGLVSTILPSSENDINTIIKTYFTQVSEKLIQKIP